MTSGILAVRLTVVAKFRAGLSRAGMSKASVNVARGRPAKSVRCRSVGGLLAVIAQDGFVVSLTWCLRYGVGLEGAI